MATVKENVAKVTGNPVGAIGGGLVAFFAAKKLGKVQNKWVLGGITVVGIIAGAMIQAKIKAKKSQPTAAEVKKPA